MRGDPSPGGLIDGNMKGKVSDKKLVLREEWSLARDLFPWKHEGRALRSGLKRGAVCYQGFCCHVTVTHMFIYYYCYDTVIVAVISVCETGGYGKLMRYLYC